MSKQSIQEVLQLKQQYKGMITIIIPDYINHPDSYIDKLNSWLHSNEILELSDKFFANKYLCENVLFNVPTIKSQKLAKEYQRKEEESKEEKVIETNKPVYQQNEEKSICSIISSNEERIRVLQQKNKSNNSVSWWNRFV